MLEIDLKQPGVSIRAVRADDHFKGLETVRSMARRFPGPGRAVAAVNGDFFNIKTGESENNVVIEGNLLKGETITDSPYDTFNNVHSQFGVGWNNRPVIDRFVFAGRARVRGGLAHALDALNFWPGGNSLVLYTPGFGDSTAVDSIGAPRLSLQLRRDRGSGDTLLFTVVGRPELKKLSLAQGGALVASGSRRTELTQFQPGRTVRVILGLTPAHPRLRTLVGGWPRIIVHGKGVANAADPLEGTFPRFSSVRHPRTAIGFSRDSSKVFLVAVDGRRESGVGMSLTELSRLMLTLGAFEAMNLDGGGSTTMVVNGEVVNSPSDKTGERAVGSALLVVVDP